MNFISTCRQIVNESCPQRYRSRGPFLYERRKWRNGPLFPRSLFMCARMPPRCTNKTSSTAYEGGTKLDSTKVITIKSWWCSWYAPLGESKKAVTSRDLLKIYCLRRRFSSIFFKDTALAKSSRKRRIRLRSEKRNTNSLNFRYDCTRCTARGREIVWKRKEKPHNRNGARESTAATVQVGPRRSLVYVL